MADMKTQWTANRASLTAKRIKFGLSPNELGQLIGVTGQTIRNWESGLRSPDMDYVSRLANLFRVSPGAFWMLVSARPRPIPKANKNRTAAATVKPTRAKQPHDTRKQ